MIKKLFVILLCLSMLVGCSATNNERKLLVTDIVGENNLSEEQLTDLLHEQFSGIDVKYEEKYFDEFVNIYLTDAYEVPKTQEDVDQAVRDSSLSIMIIARYVAENYKYDNACRINLEMKLNGATITYFTGSDDFNYLEGGDNATLLNSYMNKITVFISGDKDIKTSLINSFKKQFNITPEYI